MSACRRCGGQGGRAAIDGVCTWCRGAGKPQPLTIVCQRCNTVASAKVYTRLDATPVGLPSSDNVGYGWVRTSTSLIEPPEGWRVAEAVGAFICSECSSRPNEECRSDD